MSEKENKELEVNGEVEETMDDTVETEETVEDTPEEVVEDTTEETTDTPEENKDVESMSEALDASVEIKPGDIVEGVILAFDEDKNVIVGLDTGHEGYIPIRELSTSRVEDPSVEAEVNRVVKGGVTVDLGVRGFVPASQLDTRFVRDLSQFEGNTYEFKIIEIDPQNRQLILSRRELLESEEEEKRAKALENLEE